MVLKLESLRRFRNLNVEFYYFSLKYVVISVTSYHIVNVQRVTVYNEDTKKLPLFSTFRRITNYNVEIQGIYLLTESSNSLFSA